MAQRFGSEISQVSQIGVETTPGTLAAAIRRLQSLSFTINPNSEMQAFRPNGAKFKTAHVQNREWTTGSISGGLAFNEIGYVLASAADKPVITQLDDGAATPAPISVWDYEFKMDQYAADDPQSYTIEQGDLKRLRARRAAYCLVNEFTLSTARQGEVEVGGSLVGQIMEDPITGGLNTTGIVEAEQVMASPKMVSVYLDTTPAAIGTTKFTGAFSFEHSISDRYGQVWVLDADQESFTEHNETEPSVTTQWTFADESGLDDIITSVRKGSRRYSRISFTGPPIGDTGMNFELDIDMAWGVSEDRSYEGSEGTYAATFTTEAEYDPTLGYALRYRVRTNRATL